MIIETNFFRFLNYSMLAWTVGNFVYYYTTYPKIPALKRRLFMLFISLLIIVILFLVVFSWTPIQVIKPSSYKGYFRYLTPNLENYQGVFEKCPIISLVFLLIMILLLIDYYRSEQANIIKSRMASKNWNIAESGTRVLTHSIKNYVLAIRSEAEAALENADHSSPENLERIMQYCNDVFSNIDQASERLRHFSMKLEKKSVNEFFGLVQREVPVPKDRINLTFAFLQADAFVYLDTYYMKEVMFNLIRNAVEAVSAKDVPGEISVSAARDRQWVSFSIMDNGEGISPENMETVFEPFFTTKAKSINWGSVCLSASRSLTLISDIFSLKVKRTGIPFSRYSFRLLRSGAQSKSRRTWIWKARLSASWR